MKPCSLSARLNLLREIIFHWDGTYWAMREGDGNASIATEIYQIQELQAGYSGGCRCSSASPADRWFIICSNGSWLDQCWTCFVSLYVINKPAHLSSLPGHSRVPLIPGSSVPCQWVHACSPLWCLHIKRELHPETAVNCLLFYILGVANSQSQLGISPLKSLVPHFHSVPLSSWSMWWL